MRLELQSVLLSVVTQCLPIAGVHDDGPWPVGVGDEGTVLSVYPHGLNAPVAVVGEVEPLMHPVIGQTLRVTQVYREHGGERERE